VKRIRVRNCLRRNFCSKCSKEGDRSGTKIKTQKEVVIIKFINLKCLKFVVKLEIYKYAGRPRDTGGQPRLRN